MCPTCTGKKERGAGQSYFCFFPSLAVIGVIDCVRLAAGCCFAARAASAAFFLF